MNVCQTENNLAFCSGGDNSIMNKTILLLTLSPLCLLFSCGNGNGVAFADIYDQIVDNHPLSAPSVVTLAKDGSYLKTDTNPNDEEDFFVAEYSLVAHEVLSLCGFNAVTWDDMMHTSYNDGIRSATKNGIQVTWRYHPDLGLEARYVKI